MFFSYTSVNANRKMKQPRQISVNKIRLTLISIVAMQFSNLLCLCSHHVSSVLSEVEVPQNFQDIDFTNIKFVDSIARKSMKGLHDELDHDDDGNVSLSEGAKYIRREDFTHSSGSNLPGFATDKDGRITEEEFWESWVRSAVHNWTASEMADWLSVDVDLPLYAHKFKQYGISGAAMPILASNSTLVLSLVDGIKEHRLKLWLKAMEVVLCGYKGWKLLPAHMQLKATFSTHTIKLLFTDPEFVILKKLGIQSHAHKRKVYLRATEIVLFGPPKSKSNLLKDALLTISIGLALGGIAYAVHVRRTAAAAMAAMQHKLNSLQTDMHELDEEDSWMKNGLTREGNTESGSTRDELNSSHSSLLSESELKTRLQEVTEELADTRNLLEQAEERLSIRQWIPPGRLITCLKNTHKVETKLHEAKRAQAQKKVEQAKSQFLKMKKKTSIFTSVQLVHSRQVDSFDLEVQLAKEFLREVQQDSHDYKKRWLELEKICNSNFVSNRPGSLENNNRKGHFGLKQKMSSNDVTLSKNKIDHDYAPNGKNALNDSVEGLHMKDPSFEDSDTESSKGMKSLRSCPTFTQHPTHYSDHRRSEPISNSATTLAVKASSNHKSPSPIPEAEEHSDSEKLRTLPKKQSSPMFNRSKDSVRSCTIEVTEALKELRRDNSPGRTISLGSSDHSSLPLPPRKSVSSRSLPDMFSKPKGESSTLGNGKSLKLTPNRVDGEENRKSTKKRSNFGSLFKRKKKI